MFINRVMINMIAFFVLITVVFWVSIVLAYDIEGIGIQNRIYSDWGPQNRAWFSVIPTDTVVPVENLLLEDPDGNNIPGTWKRLSYENITGEYNSNLDIFTYSAEMYNYYRMNFSPDSNPLKIGTYTFDINGEIHTANVQSIVDLPFVDSATLRKWYGYDAKYGENVTKFYWNLPDYTGLDQNEISLRFNIDLYLDGDFVRGIYVSMPSYINYAAIPDSVLNIGEISSTYTRASATVLLETNDWNNRTYTNELAPEDIPEVMAEFESNSAHITNPYAPPIKIGGWQLSQGVGPNWSSRIFYIHVVGVETVSGAQIGGLVYNDINCLKMNIIITDDGGSSQHEFLTFWMAQDTDGNVWVTKIFSNLNGMTALLGSEYFQSMFIPATPTIGAPAGIRIPESIYGPCEIVETNIASVTTEWGDTYTDCFKVYGYDESQQIAEIEYYCRGAGNVRSEDVDFPNDVLDLKVTNSTENLGDVTGDGKVSLEDAILPLQILSGNR
jgi:hypothetical protein